MLSLDIKGDKEIVEKFGRAGSALRESVKDVLSQVGQEITSRARASSPAKRAASGIFHRVIDGAGGKGVGRVRLVVDTRRKVRWVQQFEQGTVGTGIDTGGRDAVAGTVLMGVRSHTRGYSRGNVYGYMAGRSFARKTNVKFGLMASGFVRVRSYSHRFHMPRRPFMGPAFDAVRDSIAPRIEAAIQASVLGEGS